MSRHHKNDLELRHVRTPKATHWLWAGIIGSLAGGVHLSFQLSPSAALDVLTQRPALQTASNITVTSTLPEMSVVLGVSAPESKKDFAYTLSLPHVVLTPRDVSDDWRVEDLNAEGSLQVIPASPDGEPPQLSDGGEWNVALRNSNGEMYQDLTFIGFADRMHAYVLGTITTRQVLLVSRVGEIRVLAEVPESSVSLGIKDGDVWFATFVPGEGIESEPKGPSRLIRISQRGGQEVIAQDVEVITHVLPGAKKSLAYATQAGGLFVQMEEKRWSGVGKPLAWLRTDLLLIAQDKKVFLLDMTKLDLEFLLDVPAAPVVADVL